MTNISQKPEKIKTLDSLMKSDQLTKICVLQHYVDLAKILVNEILEDEVQSYSGERYKRNKPHNGRYSRWGSNPGSVPIGEERVKIDVPRLINKETGKNVSLQNYEKIQHTGADENRLMHSILCGISTNDYKGAAQQFADSKNLSRSKVSQRFIEESAKSLEMFSKRDISGYNFIALFIDGKYLAKEQVVIVLGITETGDKLPLDFIQTTTENSTSIRQLLSNLVERGLKYEDGLLCVIDGSKGLHKAIEEVFGVHAVIQRCQWHKRENVLSYLKESDKEVFKKKLNKAYNSETYEEAKSELEKIYIELRRININAANSLSEGLEETLTLHRLELHELFRRSFSTTNVIENLNSQLRKYVHKVKYWKNSYQRQRWVAAALLRIEQKMRKVFNSKHLDEMKAKIKKEIEKKILDLKRK
jgi:putative transposase